MIVAAKILIAVPFIFFVPGYLTSLVLRRKRSGEETIPLSEVLFFQFLISILLSSLAGLVLATAGFLSLINLTVILVVYSTALCLLFKPRFRGAFSTPKPDRSTLYMSIILVIAAAWFFHPCEYIVGGWDPGVYVNTGINLGRTGSLIIHDDMLKELSPADQEVFAHKRNNLVQKYPGFPIVDPEKGTIFSGFYHLYPVWIAIFYMLFGVRFALLVNAVFGLSSIFAVYLVGKHLFHRNVGVIAALLLAFNFAQIWYARFPTTEILTQFLIFSGFYTLAVFVARRNKEFGVISAICFGVAFFVRIDMVLLLPAVFIFFYYRSFRQWRKEDLCYVVPFAVLLVMALIYDLTMAWPATKVIVSGFGPRARLILSIVAVVFAAIFLLARIFSSMISDRLDRILSSKTLRMIFIAAMALLAIYAYFLRPHLVKSSNAANLVELGWFLTPLGLLLAVNGLMILTYDGINEKRAMFFLATLTVSCFFVYDKMIHPSYMWAIRRYVPFVIPAAAVMAGYMVHFIGKSMRRGGIAVMVLLAGGVALYLTSTGGHLYMHRDYHGTIDFCDEFAGNFDDDDILVCDGYWLAKPLKYIYGLNTLQISDQHRPEAVAKCRRAEELMYKWLSEGKDVYYITRGKGLFLSSIDLVKTGEFRLETLKLERTSKHFPRELTSFSPTVRIYSVEKIGTADIGARRTYRINIGANSFGLVEGFYGRERYRYGEGERQVRGDMRWTGEYAKVIIPWFGDDQAARLTLRMSGGRPDKISQPEITVSVDGQVVGSLKLSNSFEEYELAVPAGSITTDMPGRALLEIVSDTWSPKRAGVSEDTRSLGVQLDWINIERAE